MAVTSDQVARPQGSRLTTKSERPGGHRDKAVTSNQGGRANSVPPGPPVHPRHVSLHPEGYVYNLYICQSWLMRHGQSFCPQIRLFTLCEQKVKTN